MSCPVYDRFCKKHNFVHGAEAEELRQGIEHILEFVDQDADRIIDELKDLLDRVDARDSLAFVESYYEKNE